MCLCVPVCYYKINLCFHILTDCKDTANFVFNLLDSDGNSTKMDCAGMALFTPYLCFTNEVLFKHCCFTCHIYGLVQSNSAGKMFAQQMILYHKTYIV